MIRRPPRSTHCISSAASDVYKRQCLLRCWPPAPVPENQSISQSCWLKLTTVTSGSMIATVTVDVCTRPFRSVGGTRCILCPPDSDSRLVRSGPLTWMCISPGQEPCMRVSQPTLVANRRYASARSLTNSFASSPPSAARISITRFISFSRVNVNNLVIFKIGV